MKKVLIILIIFIVGGVVGYLICSRSANDRIEKKWQQAQRLERSVNKKIDSIQGLNKTLQLANDFLSGKIHQDSIDRAAERTKIIPEGKTIQDEAYVLKTGKELYGGSNEGNSRRANVASYGSQGLSEVIDLRKISSNQKAIIVNCESIVKYKDTIIVEYKEGLRFAAKHSKNDFTKGVIVGGGGVSALVIIGLILFL